MKLISGHKRSLMDFSDIIIKTSRRSTKIIKSMLDQAQGIEGELNSVYLEEVIDSNIKVFTTSYPIDVLKNVKFYTDFEKLPRIKVFERELGQVLINIFENSFYAITEKREKEAFEGHIKVSTKLEGEKVAIVIEDNGNGIPEELKANLFLPFKTSKPPGEGTGLGLSVSQEIIKKHQGTISFVSTAGEFTKINILLPLDLK